MSRHALPRRAPGRPRWQSRRARSSTSPTSSSKPEIRPVLAAKCYACHNSKMKEPKGYLALDSESRRHEGRHARPGARARQACRQQADSRAEIFGSASADAAERQARRRDRSRTSKRGLPAARPIRASRPPAAAAAKRRVVDEAELAKGRQWWAFQAVKVLPQPVSAHAVDARARNSITSCYAKLAEKGLTPSPQADDRTLIRRAYIDLIGLKPTYDEVEAYANDASPNKYEKLIDKLLAMPQYGERWGASLARCRALRRRQSRATSRTRRIRTRGGTATGSSKRSTRMCRTTGSSSCSSRPI